mmetsp:Transcript_31178/g.99029  ORF Transcript_31178/g.99029 Transcript_31178/m.99029 type:complete len:217 (-) Transcript_31178:566-1216(-)
MAWQVRLLDGVHAGEQRRRKGAVAVSHAVRSEHDGDVLFEGRPLPAGKLVLLREGVHARIDVVLRNDAHVDVFQALPGVLRQGVLQADPHLPEEVFHHAIVEVAGRLDVLPVGVFTEHVSAAHVDAEVRALKGIVFDPGKARPGEHRPQDAGHAVGVHQDGLRPEQAWHRHVVVHLPIVPAGVPALLLGVDVAVLAPVKVRCDFAVPRPVCVHLQV